MRHHKYHNTISMKKHYVFIPLTLLVSASLSSGATVGKTRIVRDGDSPRYLTVESEPLQGKPASESCGPRTKFKSPPAGAWESIGEGTYLEDLLTYYQDVPLNLKWKVDIEESKETSGWYRFIPYYAGSPIAEYYGSPDNTYIYINATDPDKVYVEDFLPYQEEISNVVPATGWPDLPEYQRYGKLVDGIISFELGSFGIGIGEGWKTTSLFNGFQLALPGASLPDNTLIASAPYCTDDNKFEISVEVGGDIKELYMQVIEGEWPIEYYDPYDIIDFGEKIEAKSGIFTFEPQSPGIYTAQFAGVNVDGELINATHTCMIGVFEDSDKWHSIGKGKMTESVFSSVYNELNPEIMEFEIEESNDIPGLYRLVDPYAGHSVLGKSASLHSHKHYMVINASDPERVYIEPFAVGVEYQCGEAAIWSRAGSCLMEGVTPAEIEESGYYGKREGNIITFEDYTVMLSEKDFYDGEFLCCGTGFSIELPETDGVISIEQEPAGESAYYNMQGMKVNRQTITPGVYIVRQASGKVSKVTVR